MAGAAGAPNFSSRILFQHQIGDELLEGGRRKSVDGKGLDKAQRRWPLIPGKVT